ncbi:hypothetical protein GCM10010916_04710 [Paenibacillus abyssi]|uniref:Uncharacterized protein n=1 Tax=Paenibacillus abyssi TaxID=1340531 RepID=A0A917CKK5_9BACL|nr:hypothetical protein GCM10010916_04710 [Paenibacillus abyssi]
MRWYKTILKGPYNSRSILNITVNLLFFVSMAAVMSMQFKNSVYIEKKVTEIDTVLPYHTYVNIETVRGRAAAKRL